jgi:hypothetical protein
VSPPLRFIGLSPKLLGGGQSGVKFPPMWRIVTRRRA